jgi:hypothetical protein
MKKIIVVSVAILFIVISMSFDIMHKSGASGVTKSPGETDCNTSGCHTGNLVNASGGSIAITSVPTFTGGKYIPGQTYTVSVKVARTSFNLFGFDFEALKSNATDAGIFTITNDIETKIDTAGVAGKLRANVVHVIYGGASAGSHTFTFDWKAPAAGTGTVTLYAAGNAANGNGTTSGDYIYNTSKVLTEDTSIGISEQNDNSSAIRLVVYPNPVVSSVNLSYELDKNSKVSAKLFSLNGQLVTSFFNEERAMGKQEQKLEIGSWVPKGIYLLSLEVDGEFNLKKMIVQ